MSWVPFQQQDQTSSLFFHLYVRLFDEIDSFFQIYHALCLPHTIVGTYTISSTQSWPTLSSSVQSILRSIDDYRKESILIVLSSNYIQIDPFLSLPPYYYHIHINQEKQKENASYLMNISTSYCLSHKYTCKPITSTIHSLFCSIPLSTTLYYTTTTFQSVIRDYFTQLCKVLESQSSLFFPQHMNEFYDESIAIHDLYQCQSITDNELCQFLYDSQSISLSNPVYESFYIFHLYRMSNLLSFNHSHLIIHYSCIVHGQVLVPSQFEQSNNF